MSLSATLRTAGRASVRAPTLSIFLLRAAPSPCVVIPARLPLASAPQAWRQVAAVTAAPARQLGGAPPTDPYPTSGWDHVTGVRKL